MHEKSGFFALYFRNISKMLNCFDENIEPIYGVSIYNNNKTLYNEYRKIYFFKGIIINYFVNMSVSECALTNFVYTLASNSKNN